MVKDRVIVTVGSTKYGGKTERTFKIQGDVELDPTTYASNWIVNALGDKSAKILLEAMQEFRRGGKHEDGLTAKAFQKYQNKLAARLRFHATTDSQKKFVSELQKGWNKAIKAGVQQKDERERLFAAEADVDRLTTALEKAPKGSDEEKQIKHNLEQMQTRVENLTPRVKKSLREGFNRANRTHVRPDRFAAEEDKDRMYLVGDAPKKLSPAEVQARKEYNAAQGVDVPVGDKINMRQFGASKESLDKVKDLIQAFKSLEKHKGKKHKIFDVNNPQDKQEEKLAKDKEYLDKHAKAVALLEDYDAEHDINNPAFDPTKHPKAQGAIEPRFTTIQQVNAARANGVIQLRNSLKTLAKQAGVDFDESDSSSTPPEEPPVSPSTPPEEPPASPTTPPEEPPTETPKKKSGTPKKPRTPRKPKAAKPAPVDAHKVVQDRIFNSPEDANEFIQQSMTAYPAAEKKIQNWMQKNNIITATSSAKDPNVIPWPTPDMSFDQKKQLNALRDAVIDIQVAQGDGANNIEKMKGQKAIKFLQGQGYNDPKQLKLQSKNEAAAELGKKQQKPQTWEENPYAPREVLLTYIEDIRVEEDKGLNPINIEKLTRMRELANEIRKIKANDVEAFNRLEEDSGPDFKGLFDFARKINAHVKKNWAN